MWPVRASKTICVATTRPKSRISHAKRLTVPMKPTSPTDPSLAPLLVFGAHPDDIEFGCGGIIAKETMAGRAAHLVVCSRGESGSRGTPAERIAEAEQAAATLEASLEFLDLDGDAHLSIRAEHAIAIAR